jgi:hypothetical protein
MPRSEKSDTRVMRTKFAMLFFLVLAATAFAGGLQQIRSPNRSKVLLVDSSGRRDIISIKSGSKVIRLFYGNEGDALDAWKPQLSKLYGIPENQIGKIVLPSFVAAKWISDNEVYIDLESGFTEEKNFDSFEFAVRALVRGDGKTLKTDFAPRHG